MRRADEKKGAKQQVMAADDTVAEQLASVEAAVKQQKQAHKEATVEPNEVKTAPVDTTEDVEEADDKSHQQHKGLNEMG